MIPLSSKFFVAEKELFIVPKKTINVAMIKNFLIINFTGKNDSIGLRVNNNFFVKKINNNIRNKTLLVNKIFEFIKEKNVNIDRDFSVIVNIGPGSFQLPLLKVLK